VRHWFAKRPAGGFAAVAVRISHHFAAVCPEIEPFEAEGFVALAMVNGRQRMVVWSGIASCSAPARCRLPAAPQQAADGLGPGSSVMAVGEIPLARAALALAVSCPVSEYDRSSGIIGERQPG
jgi:delta1-piperideine-2-carboxylate reductase